MGEKTNTKLKGKKMKKLVKALVVAVVLLSLVMPAFAFKAEIINNSDKKLVYSLVLLKASGSHFLSSGELPAGETRELPYDYFEGLYVFTWRGTANNEYHVKWIVNIPAAGLFTVNTDEVNFERE